MRIAKISLMLLMLISLGLTAQVCESQYGKIVISPETTYGYAPQYIEATSYYDAVVNITWDFYDTKLKKNSVLEYLGGEWIDISDRVIHKLVNGHHTYSLLNIPFQANQSRNVRLTVYTPMNTTGKYDLYIWQGDWQNPNIRVMCDPFWNNSFSFRKNITIESKTNEPEYSIRVVLNLTNFNFSKANATGQDIRFTNDSQELVPMFIENYSFTDNFAILWFKGNLTVGNRTFWMYYGNDLAINLSNPNAVFIEYDDFEDASLNLTRWDNHTDSIFVNTSQKVAGSQSFYFVPQSKAYIMDTTPSVSRSVLTEAWYYDNGNNQNNFFSCMSQNAFVSDYFLGRSGVSYKYLVGGAQKDVALPEAVGWHKLGCIINATNVYYFFTNQQYNYTIEAENSTSANWNGTAMGDINGGATKSWGHYDFYRTRYFTSGGLIYTFGVEEIVPSVEVILISPPDTSQNVTNELVQFVFNTTSRLEIKNASLWTKQLIGGPAWSIKQMNQSEITNGTNFISSNDFLAGKFYIWNIQVCDINDECGFAPANYTFNYTIVPVSSNITVVLQYPANNSINNSRTVIFGYNVSSALNISHSDLWSREEGGIWGLNRCNLTAIINGTVNEIPSFNFDTGIKYEWTIQVADINNFSVNATPNFFFTYNFTPSPPANISISIDIGADQPYTELCTNSSHLERTLFKKICDNVGCTDIRIGENISCPYGCFEDTCALSPSGSAWNILWFFAGMVVLILVLWIFVGRR